MKAFELDVEMGDSRASLTVCYLELKLEFYWERMLV